MSARRFVLCACGVNGNLFLLPPPPGCCSAAEMLGGVGAGRSETPRDAGEETVQGLVSLIRVRQAVSRATSHSDTLKSVTAASDFKVLIRLEQREAFDS